MTHVLVTGHTWAQNHNLTGYSMTVWIHMVNTTWNYTTYRKPQATTRTSFFKMQTKQILYVLWTSTVWALQYLQHPLEVLEVAWVNCLNIMVCHFHTQYMFVERASEIHIQQLPIKQCLGHLKRITHKINISAIDSWFRMIQIRDPNQRNPL